MNKKTDEFTQRLLQEYESNFTRYQTDPDEMAIARSWLRRDTVDAWLHGQMWSALDPVLAAFPDSQWLTVGDGRYCTDARYIQDKGHDVLATDVCEGLLKQALELQVVEKNQMENAESLSFDDNSFDFVLCKESYHHCTRPMKALYEMLRVAREGVVLIEPREKHITNVRSPRLSVRLAVGAVLHRMGVNTDLLESGIRQLAETERHWEELGNFVYTISEEEICKVAMGLNLPVVCFKGIHVPYENGVEFEEATDDSKLFKHIKSRIANAEKSKSDPNMLAAVVFKQGLSEDVQRNFEQAGFEVRNLLRSPLT